MTFARASWRCLSLALCAALSLPGCDWDRLSRNLDADGGASPYNLAFVTSTTYVAGALGSVDAADAKCNERAQAAGLAGTYVAWLSSPSQSATARLAATGARGWTLVDGRPVAESLDALTQTGRILNPIRVDETGRDLSATAESVAVITGTESAGLIPMIGQTCNGWSATSGSYTAGDASATIVYWTMVEMRSCASEGRLYCFGTDRMSTRPFDRATGRRAFLSRSTFLPSGGLTAAHGLCKSDATAQAIANAQAFVALLPTVGHAAIEGLDTNGTPWVRIDGIPWVRAAEDLALGKLLTSLNVDAGGAYIAAAAVWTGGIDPATSSAGAQHTCADWTTTTGTGGRGRSEYSARGAFDWNNMPSPPSCNDAMRIYCVEP